MQTSRYVAVAAALLVLAMPRATTADASRSPALPSAAHVSPAIRTILSTTTTVTGGAIAYPSGNPKLTAVEITLQPGEETGWHTHPVPLFGYMLEGELTVDYGAKGKRVYRKGDALAEAINEAHNGRNTGNGPMRILAVFMGAENMQDSVAAARPGRQFSPAPRR